MPEPLWVQIRFLSARAHEDSVCCSRSGEGKLMGKLFYSRFRLTLDVVCNNGKLKSDYI